MFFFFIKDVLFSHVSYCTSKIDNFWVNVAIVLEGANSGHTFIKCHDIACNAEPPLLKDFKNLTIKLKGKIFSQLHLETQIFVFLFISCLKVWL